MGAGPSTADLRQRGIVLASMAQAGTIAGGQLNAGLLHLAADFARAGRHELALTVLADLSPLYLLEDLPRQAAVDEALGGSLEYLAELLVAGGHVAEAVLRPPAFLSTQDVAKA